jgi:hypothetical protein
MVSSVVLTAILALGVVPDKAVKVSAKLPARKLKVGGEYEFVVKFAARKGFSSKKSAISRPILQIDVPDSVELVGKVLTDQKELAKNEFLMAPFERLMTDDSERVKFRLIADPKPGDHFGINIVGYIKKKKSGPSHFVRRRLELPVEAKARGEIVPPTTSDWKSPSHVQIGETAPLFDLPRANGSILKLADFIGKGNVLVITYRAFW